MASQVSCDRVDDLHFIFRAHMKYHETTPFHLQTIVMFESSASGPGVSDMRVSSGHYFQAIS